MRAMALNALVSVKSTNDSFIVGSEHERLRQRSHSSSALQSEAHLKKSSDCRICKKHFSRRDVMLRHERRCATSSEEPYHSRTMSTLEGGASMIRSDSSNKTRQQRNIIARPLGARPTDDLRPDTQNSRNESSRTTGDREWQRIIPEINSPNEQQGKSTSKRGRYVPTGACLNCKKRKVKCSGEEQCLTCCSAGLVCEYDQTRKRRSTAVFPQLPTPPPALPTEQGLSRPGMRDSVPAGRLSKDLTETPELLNEILSRLSKLERDRNRPVDDSVPVSSEYNENRGSSEEYIAGDNAPSPSDGSVTGLSSMRVIYGSSSLNEPIEVLKRSVPGADDLTPIDLGGQGLDGLDLAQSPSSNSSNCNKAPRVQDWLSEACNLRSTIDIFFTSLNPHYPCLNENQFRSQLEDFFADVSHLRRGVSMDSQFAALVYLMQAEVKALYEDCSESSCIAGWNEFCQGERILSRLGWLGDGDILTIQCLAIKTRYLFYVRKPMGAYHAIGQAARLCFQLGLHNQATWVGLSPFERVMRQRIFWTVFYLERHVAFNCGMPYSIRETEVAVDVPPHLDDREMFPNKPLPEPCPERSVGPYLGCVVKWARMCGEIWEKFFRVGCLKPISQELVASMDGIIMYTVSQFPKHLQWERNVHRLEGGTDAPLFIMRQTLILHLRINQLRLLLRQESILTLKFDEKAAEESAAIAQSSINAVHDHGHSAYGSATDRFSATVYIVGAVLTLICIIIKTDNAHRPPEFAIEAFNRGLSLLNGMSPKFKLARYFTQRLARVIETAQQSIRMYQNPDNFALDPLEFETETLVPQMVGFFNDDYWNLELEKDILGQRFQIS